jgi:hypothetical protein
MSVPEVRQNLDPSHPDFGSVAIDAGVGCWKVVFADRTGHVGDDAVESWHPLNEGAREEHGWHSDAESDEDDSLEDDEEKKKK